MNGIIYKIINNVNDKIYVGKTTQSPEVRWRQHKMDASRPSVDTYIYRAMRKHGVHNFSMEIVEELTDCDSDYLSRREMYWIEHFHGYSEGYNSTRGGDGGGCLYDIDSIIALMKAGYKNRDIIRKLGCCDSYLCKIRRTYNLPSLSRGRAVSQYDLDGNFIQDFPSLKSATEWLRENGYPKALSCSIGRVCRGDGFVAYGYDWRYKYL